MTQAEEAKTLEIHFYGYMMKFSVDGFKDKYYMITVKNDDPDRFLIVRIKTENGKVHMEKAEPKYITVSAERFVDLFEMIVIHPEKVYARLTGEKVKIEKVVIKDYRSENAKDLHLLDYQLRVLL